MTELHPSPAANTNAPLVSIGLPTYNRPPGLQAILDCIGKQTYANLEIIISDNCSTKPEVAAIINQYAAKDKRVKYFRQEENIGLENNFNFVYAKASGDYFLWMSDDDLFDPNYIEACVEFLANNPDHVLCSGQALYHRDGEFSFKEDMMPVTNGSAFSRASRFFNRMQQNGKFYGVFRNKLLGAPPLDVIMGCDWSSMAKLAILGKLNYTGKTNYHRAMGGNSDTRKKLVQRFGYNKFKSLFLETYSAYLISTHIFNDPAIKQKMGWFQRQWLVIVVFFKVNWLHLVNAVRRRIKKKK